MDRVASFSPQVVNTVVRDALLAHVVRGKASSLKQQNGTSDDHQPTRNTQPRLMAFLSASVSFSDDVDTFKREELLSDLVILGHHPSICKSSDIHETAADVHFLRRKFETGMDRALPKGTS